MVVYYEPTLIFCLLFPLPSLTLHETFILLFHVKHGKRRKVIKLWEKESCNEDEEVNFVGIFPQRGVVLDPETVLAERS